MRRREGFVKVVVENVDSHISRSCHAEKCVHVRAVAVNKAACVVDHLRDCEDVALENAECVRVGEHDACNFVGKKRFERVKVDFSVLVALKDDNFKSVESAACGVRAVCAVGDDYFFTFLVAHFVEIASDDADSGVFTVSTGRRIERASRESADFSEHSLHFEHDLESSLCVRCRSFGVKFRELRVADKFFVYLRVVFHRAAAERIETVVKAVVVGRKSCVVADYIDFAEFRKVKVCSAELCRKNVLRSFEILFGKRVTASSFAASFKDYRFFEFEVFHSGVTHFAPPVTSLSAATNLSSSS